VDEETYCKDKFGLRPLELLDDFEWLGSDVWLAHCVHLNGDDIRRIARSGTAVAWCPTSNLRLGSGIAPARELLDAGVPVELAVDGSASNDGAQMQGEVRQAMLVARARGGNPRAMNAREALRVATRGGAQCLGRDDIGSLEPGRRGDVALFALDSLALAGAEADPAASLVFCSPQRVRHLIVEGRAVVREGHLVHADEEAIAREGHRVGRHIAQHGRVPKQGH
jgi:cytosine/adenosine deaminase-related metal-dependent hydrolase